MPDCLAPRQFPEAIIPGRRVAGRPARSPTGISAAGEVEITPGIEPTTKRRLRDAEELLARERDVRRQLEGEKTARERLLAMMTTELVTQANVAMGWLDLIRREHLATGARETAFAKVGAALNAQLSMLDELVGMSPAAAGHVNLDCRRVDLATVARTVAADVGDERVHVVATETAAVVADIEHLIRAVRSLVDAATRITQSVTLYVSVSCDSARVRFSNAIRDCDDALPIARRVAHLYGGDISVTESETVFTLPLADAG